MVISRNLFSHWQSCNTFASNTDFLRCTRYFQVANVLNFVALRQINRRKNRANNIKDLKSIRGFRQEKKISFSSLRYRKDFKEIAILQMFLGFRWTRLLRLHFAELQTDRYSTWDVIVCIQVGYWSFFLSDLVIWVEASLWDYCRYCRWDKKYFLRSFLRRRGRNKQTWINKYKIFINEIKSAVKRDTFVAVHYYWAFIAKFCLGNCDKQQPTRR